MAHLLTLAALLGGLNCSFEDLGPERALPAQAAGRGLSLHRAAGARVRSPCAGTAAERIARRPRGRYPPRRRAGLTVSRCERGAFRRNDRTATEARVRSPSLGWYQLLRLNRSVERDSNPRRHDCKSCALSTELSSQLVETTGIEPAPPG